VTFEDDGQLYTAQSGYCSFHPRRANKTQKIEHIKLSYCQKNKWEDDWAQYWFYAKISFPASGPSVAVSYPLSAKVVRFNHVSKANFKRTAAGYKDCCAAFATATSVIGGRDLVEEYVVSKVWPLSCGWLPKEFTKIKIDHLVKELPFPLLVGPNLRGLLMNLLWRIYGAGCYGPGWAAQLQGAWFVH